MGLVTGILILPQRQAVLVAKQAATVDVLSGGRLCRGVAVGRNTVEFDALAEEFGSRGRRIEEQVEVMRALWTRELVAFEGHWHRIARRRDQPAARSSGRASPSCAGRRASPPAGSRISGRAARLRRSLTAFIA